jgi:hypothetical protein
MHSPLMAALQHFETAEANLNKLERVWQKVVDTIPDGAVFGDNLEYEDACRSFASLVNSLPKIDGWKPEPSLPEINDIAQRRLDALQLADPEISVHIENEIFAPGKEIRAYRFRFNAKRRALIRDVLAEIVDLVDADIWMVRQRVIPGEHRGKIVGSDWDSLKSHIDQIDVLLGSSVRRPERWSDLQRHLHFAEAHDFSDIELIDWPVVKKTLRNSQYGMDEPLPNEIDDLSDLLSTKPKGPVTIELSWSGLSAESFERLIFALISETAGYENPQWLMQTNAPDKGRDLSVTRVVSDGLSGVMRSRVIVQCKHWLGKSVGVLEIATTMEQMKLWTPPRVDVLVIATSGRFTADAVQWVEAHNNADQALRIEMWPESHLERLLASRPALIAEFGLRNERT